MKCHHHFPLDLRGMWAVTTGCSGAFFFLTSQAQVPTSEWWTGCPPSHCTGTITHLDSPNISGAAVNGRSWVIPGMLTSLLLQVHQALHPVCSVPHETQDTTRSSPRSPEGRFPGQCGPTPLISLQPGRQIQSRLVDCALLPSCSLAKVGEDSRGGLHRRGSNQHPREIRSKRFGFIWVKINNYCYDYKLNIWPMSSDNVELHQHKQTERRRRAHTRGSGSTRKCSSVTWRTIIWPITKEEAGVLK